MPRKRKGEGIIDDVKNLGRKAIHKLKNVGHTIVHKTNETVHQTNDRLTTLKDKLTTYANAVRHGRNDYPPKVRNILEKYGNQLIDTIIICRTPVPNVLTSALNAVSLGQFGNNLKNSPYDKLFHLFIRISVDNGMVLTMEKNEVINMDIDPPIPKGTQELRVNTTQGLTPLTLLDNAKNLMGNKFFNYSARDNNCQDFILAIFNGSNIGNEEDRQFIKQNTKELFGDNTFLRKVSNSITDLGGVVNTITTGAGLHMEKGAFTKYFKNRAKKYRHLKSLEEMAEFILQHPNDFTKYTMKRALFYHNHEKKYIDSNMGRKRKSEGEGIKEAWNNSRFGKSVNSAVKRHKGVIDAIRQDPSVQNLYHSKHIAPYHHDIDAAVHHFGSGLGTGLYAGNPMGGGIHHHHHYQIAGEGMWDWADPKKNGVAKAFDPNQNGVAKAFQPVTTAIQSVPKPQDLGTKIRDEMEKRGINNKGALKGLKTAGHYGIPALTSSLGGIAGATLGGAATGGLGGYAGGVAGSAAGAYAGDKINHALGIGLHPGQGRFRKGSQEAKEHMARLRAMRKKH